MFESTPQLREQAYREEYCICSDARVVHRDPDFVLLVTASDGRGHGSCMNQKCKTHCLRFTWDCKSGPLARVA